MGLLDQLAGMMGAGAESGTNNGLMESAIDLIRNQEGGGLGGLLESFKNKGLGDIIGSWISTGENQPITAGQLEQVIGSERIQQIAEKIGMSPEQISEGLANTLPQIIDKLTPEGTVPEGDLLQSGLSLLKNKLFGG